MIRYLLLLLLPFCAFAQSNQFESEIQAFEKADRTTPPPQRPIVFTGSSSIRLWENLNNYFPNKTILQRGFGGSTLNDVIHYADRVIIPYNPRQVVLYAGENDVATGVTGQQTYERFVTLFEHVRKKLPNVPFVFIALKPSPSRRKYFAEMDAANRLIQQFMAKQKKADFVDIRPVMLTKTGQPVPELFKSDSLHMLPAGYERWARVLKPYLQ